MTTVVDLKNRLSKVDVGFESETAIDATKGDMITKQKDQLLHGLRRDSNKIGKYKSNSYARKKNSLNPLPGFGNMDWKLTGQLHKEIFVDVRSETFVIDSADDKTGKLIERFSDPFGLTKENQADYVEESLRPRFMKQMHEATGL